MKYFILKTLFIITFFIAIYSCKSKLPIEPKPFADRNNPEHVFNLNISNLKDTIVSFFTIENQYQNKILNKIFYYYYPKDSPHLITFGAETINKAVFGEYYFSKSNTSNDIYLPDMGDVWLSKLYFSNGKPLEYRTSFIIKLEKIDTAKTAVKIIAEEPRVINGISGYSAHGAVARETSVQPTTIEEYTLLLFIPNKLGDKTMLPLKLPK